MEQIIATVVSTQIEAVNNQLSRWLPERWLRAGDDAVEIWILPGRNRAVFILSLLLFPQHTPFLFGLASFLLGKLTLSFRVCLWARFPHELTSLGIVSR